MEKIYKYAGVDKGCIVASNQLGPDADALELAMSDLYEKSIEKGLKLDRLIGDIFFNNDYSSYSSFFGKTNGDKFILNTFRNISYRQGHYAKINGIWMCTNDMAQSISQLFFGKKMQTTKKEKDYTYVLNLLSKSTDNKYRSYMFFVNEIAKINECSESHAKALITKFVKDEFIIKHNNAKSYKIADTADIVNVAPEPTIPTVNIRDLYAGLDMNIFTADSIEYKLALSFIGQHKNALYVKDIVAFMHTNDVYFENDVRCVLLLLESNGLIAISDKYDTIKAV